MMSEAQFHDQTFSYFLIEAQDLLGTIEQNLLTLRGDRSAAKVHELMRAAHTLKGAAASVKFDSMKSIAHSFEDVFKALFKPEVEIDSELEALLYEGYNCLRSPLSAALAGVACVDSELLDRSDAIFTRIRAKLGKHFDPGAALPTSTELGFDIARSLFEIGVNERLEALSLVISQREPTAIAEALRTQAEVFLGLAESLNLSGFRTIAQATLTALEYHPNQVIEIAEAALADFRGGQAAVLNGDRAIGGTISTTLQQLATQSTSTSRESASWQLPHAAWSRLKRFLDRTPDSQPLQEPQPPLSEPLESSNVFSIDPSFEELTTAFEQIKSPIETGYELWDEPLSNPVIESEPAPEVRLIQAQPEVQPIQKSVDTIRVSLEHLDSLSYITSELLISQNQQTLQDEQLQIMLRELLTQLKQHQSVLMQLRDWSDREMSAGTVPQLQQNSTSNIAIKAFDVLEFDRYGEFQLLLQDALEEAGRLETGTEAIDFLARQTQLVRNNQGRLLTNLRDDLINVRMMPIGTLLNRFPPVVQQLMETYGKTVELRISGTQVLVDKALAEKLYDPLLHLVRNAFDHGVEPEIQRQQQGKSIAGVIRIRAYQKGNRTVIEVSDDGRGLNLQKICQRGFELQHLSSDRVDQYPEAELLNLLFEPGFSTADRVSDLSGRGIGLDAVRSQLQAIQGNVTVTSQPNQGTTFSLQLPLTLMSARLLVCQAGQAVYGLLTDDVERIAAVTTSEIEQLADQRVLQWQHEGETHTVPIYSLAQSLTYTTWIAKPTAETEADRFGAFPTLTRSILVLRRSNSWIGVEVDRVLGEQELVIRPLGRAIAPPSYVYGCSVLGDGRMLLVIDAATVVQSTTAQQALQALPSVSSRSKAASILVIDDSITVRQALTSTLEQAGYTVIQAQDGLDAIAQLDQHAIQLITCDIEMPRLNGFEFLTRYKQDPSLNQVPVVMLTSRSNEKHQQIAKQLGAAAYLTKPFDQAQLLPLIEQLIKVVR